MRPLDITRSVEAQSKGGDPLRDLGILRPIVYSAPEYLSSIDSWHGHIPFAYWIVDVMRPRVLVELGTHSGDSYFSFCQAVAALSVPAACYAVDTWKGDEHAGFYDESVFAQVSEINERKYSGFSRLLRSTFDEARAYLPDGSIDLLHIDGMHTYEAVKHDFESWLPKLSERGVVLLHDTNVRERGFGVWKLWQELSARYPSFEFLHSHGLGVLAIGPAAPAVIRQLGNLDNEGKFLIRSVFSRLGDTVLHTSAVALKDKELNRARSELDLLGSRVRNLEAEVASLRTDQAAIQGKLDHLKAVTEEQAKDIAEKDVDIAEKRVLIQSLIEKISSHGLLYFLSPRRLAGRIRRSPLLLPLKLVYWLLRRRLRVRIHRLREDRRIRSSGMVDLAYYMQKNPDVVKLGMDPVTHYISYGEAEGRSPNAYKGYQGWISLYDKITESDRTNIRNAINALNNKPIISVIMPVYNTSEALLARAIESVQKQLYSNFELCIADDCSTKESVRATLERYRTADSRIKIIYRTENGHISAASNSALSLVTGEFVALLDHDDELAEHALYMVADAINRHPDANILYSDEDKIDLEGRRSTPYFKSDWNPDLFLGHNFINHLGVYRAEALKAVGGFRDAFVGSQDYDLALRVVERSSPEKIVHIPHVLYHWRMIPGSVALDGGEKEYAHDAARSAIQEHLDRKGTKARVTAGSTPHLHRVVYPVPDPQPLVSVIIPSKDQLELLRRCVNGILNDTDYENLEVIVVDNLSSEPKTLRYLDEIAAVRRVRVLRYDKPFNYSAINNWAVRQSSGDLVCLLNNDTEVIAPGWLEEMVSHAMRPEIGAVGAKLYYPNDTIQHVGVVLGIGGVAGHIFRGLSRNSRGYFNWARLIRTTSAVTGACLVVRKSVYDEVGGLDEEKLTVAFNDVDFCIRIRELGYYNLITPYAELYHHESVSRGVDNLPVKRQRFLDEVETMASRWGATLMNDPFYSPNLTQELYSPNLTQEHEDFSLAFPPRTIKPWIVKE